MLVPSAQMSTFVDWQKRQAESQQSVGPPGSLRDQDQPIGQACWERWPVLKFYLGQSLGCFSVPVLFISLLTAGRDSHSDSSGGAWLKWRDEQLLLAKGGGLARRQAGDRKAAYGNSQTPLLKWHQGPKWLLWERLGARAAGWGIGPSPGAL